MAILLNLHFNGSLSSKKLVTRYTAEANFCPLLCPFKSPICPLFKFPLIMQLRDKFCKPPHLS